MAVLLILFIMRIKRPCSLWTWEITQCEWQMTALRETIKDVLPALFQTLQESYKQQKRTLKNC